MKLTSKIHIYRNNVWAGTGTISPEGAIVDCAAVLGIDQDASDDTYDSIEDAMDTDEGSVTRPDGVYSWVIDDT